MNLNELELFVEEEESVNPFSEDEGGIDGLLNANITCYTNGLQVESIISSLNTDYYLIPKFQRKFVWNKTQVSYLALSIIKSIPIPPLYLYVDRKKQVLLDGEFARVGRGRWQIENEGFNLSGFNSPQLAA